MPFLSLKAARHPILFTTQSKCLYMFLYNIINCNVRYHGQRILESCTTDRTSLVFLWATLECHKTNSIKDNTCPMPFPTAATTKGMPTWIADMSKSTMRTTQLSNSQCKIKITTALKFTTSTTPPTLFFHTSEHKIIRHTSDRLFHLHNQKEFVVKCHYWLSFFPCFEAKCGRTYHPNASS